MTNTVTWPCETIWQMLAPLLPGFTVEVVPEIDSTNAELMRRAHVGQLDPLLLVAEHQTAGRGRLGRQWQDCRGSSEPGSLMFSLGLPLEPQNWSGLSLAVGLSLAQSLHPEIVLKWPNDLWWHDRKLAGILIETVNWSQPSAAASRYVIIGIGLNITHVPANGCSTQPAALVELLPQTNAAQALTCISLPLVQAVLAFERSGFAPFQKAFNARDALDQVAVTLGNDMTGTAHGVDATGALLVQTLEGVQRITSDEVSVRPQPGPDYRHL